VENDRLRDLNAMADLIPKFGKALEERKKAKELLVQTEELFSKDCNNMVKEKLIDAYKKYLTAFQTVDGMVQHIKELEKRTGMSFFEDKPEQKEKA
jgi:hypothetical protein